MILKIFSTVYGKSPLVLRLSWIAICIAILWRCILLSEVCMIKTVPHSTVSPQMWCINDIKGWFTRTQICWQDFSKINLSNAKNSAGIFFPGLINLRWSRAIMALNKCDRRWLPVFGCTYEAINSMWDLVHSWAVCKLFFAKSHECALKLTELWNTSLLFDLNYKFINGSLAFSPS